MEKQDLDNLQQITEGYSQSGTWLGILILGSVFTITGILMYFKIVNSFILSLIVMASIFVFAFGSKYLNRVVMRKGLGYVRPKGEITSLKQQLSREQIFIAMLAPCLAIIFLLIASGDEKWDIRIGFAVAFLGIGFISMIVGLINRKKHFFYNSFFYGLYYIICAVIWMLPTMKHIFHTHKNAPNAIMGISVGLGLILVGIINYFQYKKIIQKIKGTT